MAKNTKFYKVTIDELSIKYASVISLPKTDAHTEKEYNEVGEFRNEIQPSEVSKGKIVSKTSYQYDETQNAIVANYEFENVIYMSIMNQYIHLCQ